MGGGSTAKTDTQATARVEPWSEQQPYLSHIYGQTKALYNKGLQPYFPGQQVAAFNPLQQEAFGQIQAERLGSDFERQMGSHLIDYANAPRRQGSLANDANRQLQDTIRGGGYNNPWLDDTFNQAAEQIGKQYTDVARPRRNLQFARAGRSGSVAEGMANQQDFDDYVRNVGGLATGIYGGAYQQERANQLATAEQAAQGARSDAQYALGQVPTLSGLMDSRTDRFLNLGDRVQQQSQNKIQADMARFNHYQQQPMQMLDWYANLILGHPSTQSQSDSSTKQRAYSLQLSPSIFGK